MIVLSEGEAKRLCGSYRVISGSRHTTQRGAHTLIKTQFFSRIDWRGIKNERFSPSLAIDYALLLAIILFAVAIVRTLMAPDFSDDVSLFARDNNPGKLLAEKKYKNFRNLAETLPFAPLDTNFRTTQSSKGIPITNLRLVLRGVHVGNTGKSSAIIDVPDVPETSYAIGDQLILNVILTDVFIDRIHITHSGVLEQLYLDGVEPKKVNQTP